MTANINTTRDSQRSKAQTATTAARRADDVTFARFETAQAYLDKHIRTRWFRTRWPEIADLGVVVKPLAVRAENGWAWETEALRRIKYKTAIFPIIYLPTWTGTLFETASSGFDALLLWHLVAHHCAKTPLHDAAWARALLDLVRHYLGQAAARDLREQFSAFGVHYYARRTLTSEQRAVMRDRFYERGLAPRGVR